MLPMTMSGGPYMYDHESRRFVVRPSSEPQRKPVTDLPDEPVLPSPKVKPPLSRERRRLIVWLVSGGLLLGWLILLTVWTRQLSSSVQLPIGSSRPSLPENFSKEDFLK